MYKLSNFSVGHTQFLSTWPICIHLFKCCLLLFMMGIGLWLQVGWSQWDSSLASSLGWIGWAPWPSFCWLCGRFPRFGQIEVTVRILHRNIYHWTMVGQLNIQGNSALKILWGKSRITGIRSRTCLCSHLTACSSVSRWERMCHWCPTTVISWSLVGKSPIRDSQFCWLWIELVIVTRPAQQKLACGSKYCQTEPLKLILWFISNYKNSQ